MRETSEKAHYENGNLRWPKYMDRNPNSIFLSTYDANGHLTAEAKYDASGNFKSEKDFTYDSEGRLIKEVIYDSGRPTEESWVYIYDAIGNWIKRNFAYLLRLYFYP
jgi:antitoxin component YwqK of YwqJK toxin-antitoxin module